MGLGAWKGRTTWPLPWLQVEESLRIFGIIMTPSFSDMVELNWSNQYEKFRATLFSWATRSLTTLSERAEILNTFGLSRVWYRAQILPIPNKWKLKFDSEIRKFLWRNHTL